MTLDTLSPSPGSDEQTEFHSAVDVSALQAANIPAEVHDHPELPDTALADQEEAARQQLKNLGEQAKPEERNAAFEQFDQAHDALFDKSDADFEKLVGLREVFVLAELKGSKKELAAAKSAYEQAVFAGIAEDIETKTIEKTDYDNILFHIVSEAKERQKISAEVRDRSTGGRFRSFFRNHPAIRIGVAAAIFAGSVATAEIGLLPAITTAVGERLATVMMGIAGYASTRDSVGSILRRHGEKADDKVASSKQETFYGAPAQVNRYLDVRVDPTWRGHQPEASNDIDRNRRLIESLERRRGLTDLDQAQGKLLVDYADDILSDQGLVENLKAEGTTDQAYDALWHLIQHQIGDESERVVRDRRYDRIKKIAGVLVGATTLGAASLVHYERIETPPPSGGERH